MMRTIYKKKGVGGKEGRGWKEGRWSLCSHAFLLCAGARCLLWREGGGGKGGGACMLGGGGGGVVWFVGVGELDIFSGVK